MSKKGDVPNWLTMENMMMNHKFLWLMKLAGVPQKDRLLSKGSTALKIRRTLQLQDFECFAFLLLCWKMPYNETDPLDAASDEAKRI